MREKTVGGICGWVDNDDINTYNYYNKGNYGSRVPPSLYPSGRARPGPWFGLDPSYAAPGDCELKAAILQDNFQ
eukprot:3784375-Prorocentrum_lima.AAC.1